jgi:undecaprenyl-phosphate 4-deoxy-4-formamido-L-arabinose transferase
VELSICVPVYKSENIMEKFVQVILEEINFVESFELILVNDGSPDGSWEKIVELKKKYSFIKGVNLIRNFSQHNAIMAGLNEATGEIIITMDDDLQHNPADIKHIYSKIKDENFDVCYTRFTNREHEKWKQAGSKFNDMIANILIKKPKDLYLSPFRGMSKMVKDQLVKYDGPYPYVDGLILSITRNITVLDVKHNKRFEGTGNYNLRKSVSLWTKMATGFSITPLRFATYFGIVTAFFSFLLLFFYIFQKLIYNSMPDGWTSIIVLILFFGGVQLISIGLIGEYVGRTYLNINKKAQFIIRDRI